MVPLTSSSEAEGVLGRVAGMGPSALLEGLEEPSLKAPSASLNSSLPGSQNFLSKLELALGHDRTSQLKVAGSRGTPSPSLSFPGFQMDSFGLWLSYLVFGQGQYRPRWVWALP